MRGLDRWPFTGLAWGLTTADRYVAAGLMLAAVACQFSGGEVAVPEAVPESVSPGSAVAYR